MKCYIKWCVGLLLYIAGWLWLIFHPFGPSTDISRVSCFLLLVDSIPFLMGLIYLHPSVPITLWKPVVYLALVVIPSVPFFMITSRFINNYWFPCLVFSYIGFFTLNIVLWRVLFKATKQQAWNIAQLAGLVNAALCLFGSPVIKGVPL